MAVAAAMPGRLEVFILQQVDCLVAMGRRADAVALLERNLDIDGWRGTTAAASGPWGAAPFEA